MPQVTPFRVPTDLIGVHMSAIPPIADSGVTLDECAREPIHIPGSIQPHGALFALDDGAVSAVSANLTELLGVSLPLGVSLDPSLSRHPLLQGLAEDLESVRATRGVVSSEREASAGDVFSRIVHVHDGRTIVEFERLTAREAPQLSSATVFAATKSAATTLELLEVCCAQIRRWTGFDRVMGYVFQPDLSGEVVAESRSDRIDSFLGMRFPASDIPAQARALFVRNTLRFIPDVGYQPVALEMRAGDPPLDLSGAVLRSVSPVHVEYLQNMGIQASMSVSIVVDNQLWGMFACHHNDPLQVPLATRDACDMVAYFAAARVQMLATQELGERRAEAAGLTSELGGQMMSAEDPFNYLVSIAPRLRAVMRAEALIIAYRGKMAVHGLVPRDVARRILDHVSARSSRDPIDARDEWPEAVRDVLGEWVGALDIEFDLVNGGHVVFLRREQVRNVRWAGKPEKAFGEGPRGARLSPRGSFAEWKENVRGRSAPWLAVTREIANSLAAELARASRARQQELEDARHHLLATLSHDLRDPLHAIRMAASVIQHRPDTMPDSSKLLATRIDRSSGRMQHMISQVLDFSRAEAGLLVASDKQLADVSRIVDDLVEESRLGHPETPITADIERPVATWTDATRLAQAYGNLLSNARHHADPGSEVVVALRIDGDEIVFSVSNQAPPIPPDVVRVLFDPLKRIERATTNRSGLGLGLYIAYRIALVLDGDLSYDYDDGRVVFQMTTPLSRGARVDA